VDGWELAQIKHHGVDVRATGNVGFANAAAEVLEAGVRRDVFHDRAVRGNPGDLNDDMRVQAEQDESMSASTRELGVSTHGPYRQRALVRIVVFVALVQVRLECCEHNLRANYCGKGQRGLRSAGRMAMLATYGTGPVQTRSGAPRLRPAGR